MDADWLPTWLDQEPTIRSQACSPVRSFRPCGGSIQITRTIAHTGTRPTPRRLRRTLRPCPVRTGNDPARRVLNRRLDGARRPDQAHRCLLSRALRSWRFAQSGDYRMVSQNARRDKVARVSLIAGTVALICAGTSARSSSASRQLGRARGRSRTSSVDVLWGAECSVGALCESKQGRRPVHRDAPSARRYQDCDCEIADATFGQVWEALNRRVSFSTTIFGTGVGAIARVHEPGRGLLVVSGPVGPVPPRTVRGVGACRSCRRSWWAECRRPRGSWGRTSRPCGS